MSTISLSLNKKKSCRADRIKSFIIINELDIIEVKTNRFKIGKGT